MSIVPLARPGRELSSWIDHFTLYASEIQSDPLFLRWAAIATIAGALERKVWITSQKKVLYPNLYTLLVGPPGSGKTRALTECEDLWHVLSDHKIAHTSLTKASLVDALKDAERSAPGHPELGTFNSLLIACGELMNLIPAYDTAFMGMLTDVYDNKLYSEKRRTKDLDFTIKHPQINMIACTTASFLTDLMPPGAWDQGFLSRTIIVYSEGLGTPKPLNLLDDEAPRDAALERALKKDLSSIGNQVGKLLFERDAGAVLEAWNQGRREHEPKHPRLTHYNTRRMVHLLKLCMVAAADRASHTITVFDVQRAQNWLTEAEAAMADIFLAMASGGDARVINECHHWLITNQVRKNQACTGAQMRQFLAGRLPSHSVERVVQLMFSTGMIRAQGTDCVWAQPPI